ncbi:EcsC family protein [Candidatus Synechococcus calcipolaris G9]|uniref:EcsC family protein n=1 Tax=Candidatus Synechococcus calcipolaris G9 TaxID=1497997 RepID=A0ABT6F2V0_9SYNE|nr:EcsC family protein [Candidatus Synechococcus calcipolaris]MDG2992187.1 EcsC family protein [Candidatus Synechococcus calcipolaris G9]
MTVYTDYEQTQTSKIQDWLDHQDVNFTKVISGALAPLETSIESLIPHQPLILLRQACDRLTANWHLNWLLIQPFAPGKDYSDLRHGSLETCDRLAEKVTFMAEGTAVIDGIIDSFAEGLGPLADTGLGLLLALQTIQRIGLCYGFAPDSDINENVNWGILATSLAPTPQARRQAISATLALEQESADHALSHLLEETTTATVEESVTEPMFEQIIMTLSEDFSGAIIPVVGSVLGAIAEEKFIYNVSETAQRMFQVRWLLNRYPQAPKA